MPNHKKPTFKRARWLVGLTQQEVSQRTKLSQTAISDLEQGVNKNPGWEAIGRLARLYGCDPFELLPLRFSPKPAAHRLVLGAQGGKYEV